MSDVKPINLFQSKAELSPFWSMIEHTLEKLRIVLIFVFLGVGVSVISLYVFATMQKKTLASQQSQLMTIVTQYADKEIMLRALRARVISLQTIMKQQVSIAPYIDTTLLIAQPPTLTSFSIGEKNSVSISVKMTTMDNAVSLIQTVVTLTNTHKILHPLLTSFSIDKDGTITMGLSYGVILSP